MATRKSPIIIAIAAIALVALWNPSIYQHAISPLLLLLSSPNAASPPHGYTTEIISLDPLLIYIHGFLSPPETAALLAAADGRFVPSEIYRDGRMVRNPKRTSLSAPLPPDHPAVRRVLARAHSFLGPVGEDDEMGVPQLVHYDPGQHYGLHHDWLREPQRAFDGSPRAFNRAVSFFAVLDDKCEGGETWFPFVEPVVRAEGESPLWRTHEDGGLAFRPVAGNALFWVNLFPNGTGDTRTVHAGMPITRGTKTAMNIWPRRYRWDDGVGGQGKEGTGEEVPS
ncbi:hypothetical protein F4810DRAFT_211142 [Camillea tinctor]|nr:hypothetical protein F4810DRAFT_211142 [Camillea tinctor]